MRFGYWLPVFGGWLRNVDDEGMAATWDYVSRLARRSEEIGFDLTLDRRAESQRHQGRRRAVARRLVHGRGAGRGDRRARAHGGGAADVPRAALLAKQAANIDHISGGRLSLNVVSSWWAERRAVRRPLRSARRSLRAHGRMARRRRRPVAAADRSRTRAATTASTDTVLEPKPVRQPRPTIYAGGESRGGQGR